MSQESVAVIDSHTAGEPTRVIINGAPDLGSGSMSERLSVLRKQHDSFRTSINNEPRGTDILVSALLCEPHDPANTAGVIFFNNTGYLGMCGHGSIGLVRTLAWLERITPGTHTIETPVGNIRATLHDDMRVSIRNIPAYRFRKQVSVDVPGIGPVTGDIAWGGNWFFLIDDHGQELVTSNVDHLTEFAWAIRQSLEANSITGKDGQPIDHIELSSPTPNADSRNFMLCPGKAYDRSPCGTGTSAKLACLAEDGLLAPGETWIQEGILGTSFEASYTMEGPALIPLITGSAHIIAESKLIMHPNDPFQNGI